MLEIINKYSKYFKEDNSESFKCLKGSGHVLLSCPHAVSQLRNGVIKSAEPETGIIALTINELYKYPVIVKTANRGDDANYDAMSSYKDACIELINNNKYKCLLDLHLLNSSRTMDINIGTRGYQNIKDPQIIDILINILFKHGFTNIAIDKPFGAFNPNTISTYINKYTNIDTLQIEINSKLVYEKKNHDYSSTKIVNMIEAIKEIIDNLNNYYEK